MSEKAHIYDDFYFEKGLTRIENQPIHRIWRDAFLRPSPVNYERITHDTKASFDNGLKWCLLGFALLGVMLAVVNGLSSALLAGGYLDALFGIDIDSFNTGNTTSTSNTFNATTSGFLSFMYSLFCTTPFLVSFYAIALLFKTGINHVTARLFGGKAEAGVFMFTQSAYLFPALAAYSGITLVGSLLSVGLLLIGLEVALIFSVIVGALLFGGYVYVFILDCTAIRTTYNVGWVAAFFTSLSPLLVMVGCWLTCVVTFIGLIGLSASGSG